MNNKYSQEDLKEMYTTEDVYKWMEIQSESEKSHPEYSIYKMQTSRLKRLIPHLKFDKNDNVAEFGCGNGIFADMIFNKIKTYTGVDFSKDFIELAKKRHKKLNIDNCKFIGADIIEFSVNHKAEFDEAYSIDFTEHIYDEDFIKIFRAIKNTLKIGARLSIHTPNKDFILELLKEKGILPQQKEHIAVRNFEEYKKLLRQLGYREIKVKYISHYIPILIKLHKLSHIPIIGKFFKARLLIECIR
ncbi:methyltransferase domain-containing protein [Candidatus Peregrinibacteria bacterium]|nr:methyltransferase domain-containing protein [Candidatus Peregrinibacteria bacterium]